MATLPAVAPANTYPAQFWTINLNGQVIGGGSTANADEQFSGSFEQPIGQDGLIRQPGMRSGSGRFERVWLKANDLRSIVAANPQFLGSGGAGDIDFRFVPLQAQCVYNDGQKTITQTLTNVYLQRVGWNITGGGTRLVEEHVDFEFEKLTRS